MASIENYNLKLTSASQNDIDKLQVSIKLEVLTRHFTRLKLNPRTFSKRLSGELKGCYSYHFGHHPEYRVLFKIIGNELVILMIGKRENFYKEAYRRKL